MTATSISRRQIWNISYPIILGSIAQNIISVTDTAFLGRVGETALGASAIGGVFYLVLVMIGFGFGIGTQIIIARRDGEDKPQHIGPVLEHSLFFLTALAVALTLGYAAFGHGMLSQILSSPDILRETSWYLGIRCWGIVIIYIQVGFRAFFIGIGKTNIITYTTVVMAAVNILLDYILIFGKLGIPAMGIKGAAWASLIAEFVGTVYFLIFTLRNIDLEKYRLFKFTSFDPGLFVRMLKTSTPMMVQHFASIGSWFVFFLLIEKMGEHDLAVSQVMRSVYILVLLPLWGFSAATNTLVSNILGQQRNSEVLPLIRRVQGLCIVIMLPLVILSLAIPGTLIHIYSNDPVMIADSARVLLIIAPASILLAFSFIMFSGVSGTGNTLVSLFIEIIVLLIYLAATWFIIRVIHAPVEIVWMVEYVYGAFLALFSYIYLRYGHWQGRKV